MSVGPFTVLFVCTGTLYRSPIAERLLAARLAGAGGAFAVASAGTYARPGVALSPRAAGLIRELGGEPDGFATRRLGEVHIARAGLVLGMAREHREAAVRLCPAALRRCFTVEEFVRLSALDSEQCSRGGAVLAPEQCSRNGSPLTEDAEHCSRFGAVLVAEAAAARGRLRQPAPDAPIDDIPDPDGLPDETLRACAHRIARAVDRIAALLVPEPAPAGPHPPAHELLDAPLANG
ncbi:MAG: low molecular weight phosphatase family protein [Streptomycetaceae bacterium]|nr:low molecular weight phosphatase family protein [Streptomycetaceae bacterium]